jgi:large subunit ribosomal protein L15
VKLHDLRPAAGATKARTRVGRGIAAGKGKTAGRGTKGQKSRTGVSIKGFEGGQMPLHRRLPKRGFNNIFARRLSEVNLGRVQIAIDKGRLKADEPVNVESLVKAGVLKRGYDGVRLLGNGELKAKLNFEVDGASKSAIAAVEKAGGSVKVLREKKPEPEKAEKKPAKVEKKPAKEEGGEAKA